LGGRRRSAQKNPNRVCSVPDGQAILLLAGSGNNRSSARKRREEEEEIYINLRRGLLLNRKNKPNVDGWEPITHPLV